MTATKRAESQDRRGGSYSGNMERPKPNIIRGKDSHEREIGLRTSSSKYPESSSGGVPGAVSGISGWLEVAESIKD
jgi:hypothetical protein